jgi:hypothetical protein
MRGLRRLVRGLEVKRKVPILEFFMSVGDLKLSVKSDPDPTVSIK